MVIFELNTKEVKDTFKRIKKLLGASKSWKISTRIELTILDGLVQFVGNGFVMELKASTTGSCKLVASVMHWNELAQTCTAPVFRVVVTEGEAMVGRVTVIAQTTFFETDKILRSIQLPTAPKPIDYLKLAYQGYSKEELQFNAVDKKIADARGELATCIAKVASDLKPFRFSHAEVREMIMARLREREKFNFDN